MSEKRLRFIRSTNYKKRDEAGKITVEGNGNLKFGESTRSSSFKYTRQQLTRENDGEVGVIIVLNAKFDPAAIVGELKLSNKEILVSNSYCERSKDCAHFKLQSSYDTDSKSHFMMKNREESCNHCQSRWLIYVIASKTAFIANMIWFFRFQQSRPLSLLFPFASTRVFTFF